MSIQEKSKRGLKGLDNKRAERQAKERGCTVEYASPKTLQLDIDSEESREIYEDQLERLRLMFTVLEVRERASRSGNMHVIITLKERLSVPERIMLQACMGSDRTREILSYARYQNGDNEPILLFKPMNPPDITFTKETKGSDFVEEKDNEFVEV